MLLIALLAFMPFALGGVWAWSELVVLLGAGVIALCWTAKLVVYRDTPVVMPWLFLPVLVLALVVAVQLVPLPAGAVSRISPQTAALKTRLLSDLPNATDALRTMTFSFYPAATRAGLRMLLAASVVMLVVANVFRTPQQMKRLLSAIAVIGATAALLAVTQTLSGSRAVYWSVDIEQPALGGPFVNRNNYCMFMNLSIGAALALLLWRLDEYGFGRHSLSTVYRRVREGELWVVAALVAMIVVGAVSVFLSASRGGTASLVAAFALSAFLAGRRREHSATGWFLLVVGLLMLCGVLYAGFDVAVSRLSTLRNLQEAGGERFLMNRDVIAMLPKFPLLGIGFNAHEAVYPMFSRLDSASISGNLENEYLQIIEETGLLGLILLVAFLALLLRLFVTVMRQARRPEHAAAFGILFAMVAVLIHSMSDFGLRIPAIGCLAAAMIGLLISVARWTEAEHPAAQPGTWSRILRGAASLAVLAFLAIHGVAAYDAAVAERHWDRVYASAEDLERKDWQGSDEQYTVLLGEASAAADRAPDNAEYRRALNDYRWRALARQADPATGQMVLSDRTIEFVQRIVAELQRARVLSPTDGRIYATEGQLQLDVLGQPQGARLVRTGYELAPTDPTVTFVAGGLDAREGKWDESLQKFRRAAKLGTRPQQVVQLYLRYDRLDLALEFARDDVHALEALIDALTSLNRHPEILQSARLQHKKLTRQKAQRPDALPEDVARAAASFAAEGDHAAAVDAYRRALSRDYVNVNWRLELVRSLAARGQTEQAMQEARTCLRLRPGDPTAKRLIEELSVVTTTAPAGKRD